MGSTINMYNECAIFSRFDFSANRSRRNYTSIQIDLPDREPTRMLFVYAIAWMRTCRLPEMKKKNEKKIVYLMETFQMSFFFRCTRKSKKEKYENDFSKEFTGPNYHRIWPFKRRKRISKLEIVNLRRYIIIFIFDSTTLYVNYLEKCSSSAFCFSYCSCDLFLYLLYLFHNAGVQTISSFDRCRIMLFPRLSIASVGITISAEARCILFSGFRTLQQQFTWINWFDFHWNQGQLCQQFCQYFVSSWICRSLCF